MWVPAHVGIACIAYADAVATAYLGNNDTEDASKVVRDLSLIHISEPTRPY